MIDSQWFLSYNMYKPIWTKAFRSFKRAYYTFKNEPRDEEVIYNMAYAYLEGVWVMRNKRKGMSLLKELDERLEADGKDITKENDPDGIIKKYYMTANNS